MGNGGFSMSMPSDEDATRLVVRLGQIIAGAMVVGVSMFLVIAAAIDLGLDGQARRGAGDAAGAPAQQGGQPEQTVPILSYIALAVGAVMFPLSFLVPDLVAKQHRRAIAAGKPTPAGASPASTPQSSPDAMRTPLHDLHGAYSNQLIIELALVEGAAFFAGLAYLIEKNSIAITVAVALVASMIARFPTADRFARWLEQQQEKLREDQLNASISS
jgi:hypothetical protein